MTDWLQTGSYAQAFQGINGLFQQRAQRQAGQRVAAGDYSGGAGALLNAGDLQGGLALQTAGRTAQAAAREDAARGEAEQIAFTRQAVKALKDSQNPLADFDAMVPAFRQLGTDDSQIAQLRQGLETGGRAFLDQVDAIANQQARQLEIQNLGGGYAVAIDKATGERVNEFRAPAGYADANGLIYNNQTGEPILDAREPKYQTVQNSDGSSQVVAIDQPAPTSFAPRAAAGGGGGGADAISVIQSILPEARFTSGLRTPDQNRSAGGAANSFHLRGQAVDIAPPAGVSLADFRRQLESSGVKVRELINEGDHWHIAWEGGSTAPNIGRGEPVSRPAGGGVRIVAAGASNGPTPAAARADAREQRQQNNDDIRAQSNLRREFNARQEVKDFRTVQSAYNSVRAAARSPSAAGDLSLIFAYMKILDPGSVVREQEFATAQNAAGVPDRIRNLYNRTLNGQRLNENQRADFLSQANNLYASRRRTYDQVAQEYSFEAEQQGFDPGRIVGGQGQRQPQTNAPGLPFNVSEAQLRTRRGINGNPSAPVGSAQNPRYMNPQDPAAGWANARSGDYVVRPDGRVVRKP